MEEVQAADRPPVRLACRVAYIGDRFAGSQMQPAERTVEGEFVAACTRLGLFSDHRAAGFSAAGRTDRGVHARSQVFAFATALPSRARDVLNWQLPKDLWITGCTVVDPGFSPRYDARTRTYRYYFGAADLDIRAMDAASRHFTGTQDFSCFSRSSDRNPERTIISARVWRDQGTGVFEVSGESFLWHMVRLMAACLRRIGEGEEGEEDILRRLEGDRVAPLSPAPPWGLVLWDVDCGISFEPVPETGRSVGFVREQGEYHAVMARVCEVLLPGSGHDRTG
ncbi:trna pseudouridine synthase a [hydrocarbon metagenome]|uniref:Trna pseudouridine synthase a n=1 Tax=hydrocarbon metagenome TaxID=938273 RepID=A0A0W8EAZ4_9ZZZZ